MTEAGNANDAQDRRLAGEPILLNPEQVEEVAVKIANYDQVANYDQAKPASADAE